MSSPTHQQPGESEFAASFKPGIEIKSDHFVTKLSKRGARDPHIAFEIFVLDEAGDRTSIQSASSAWFTELVDCLEFIERKIRRDGPEKDAQVLGNCMGVRVDYDYDESKDTELLSAKLMTEDDENWHEGESFDPSLVSELRVHASEVLDLMRAKASPDSEGFGFEFSKS